MLLEIPLESYLPAVEPHDYEVFTDERLREIIDELREDPDLRNLFWQDQNDSNQEDEGVVIPDIQEEIELDFELDDRLEMESLLW